jgi:protein phosphatase
MTQKAATDTAPLDIPAAPPTVTSHGRTDKGKVRPGNEDNFLIGELMRTLLVHQSSLAQAQAHHGRNRSHIFLVADGMGGHRGGEVASALTVASIEAFVLHLLRRFSNVQTADEQSVLGDLQASLRAANARLFEEAAHHPELHGMGTTLTMAFTSNWKLFVIHAGDSRCYLLRDSRLAQLTRDHTLVGEMVRRGILTPEEAAESAHRHVVTNVLGGTETSLQADVERHVLQPNDVLLLCTDGLTEMLDDKRIAAVLAAEADPEKACERLVAEANAAGGKDNVTVIVARFAAG